jgi:tight adherence protein C
MTESTSFAILSGLGIGLGLWLLLSLLPRLRRPNLSGRVAPYLVDVSSDARDFLDRQDRDPAPLVSAVLAPIARLLRGRAGSLLGGREPIELRLRQAGLELTVDGFRAKQLFWAASAAAASMVTVVAVGTLSAIPIGGQLAVVLVATAGAFIARGYLLQRAANARVARIVKQLPTVLEFLTLSLSAGEGMLDALRRIARVSSAELATEFSTVIADVGAGMTLSEALARLASALRIVPLTRAIEQVLGALDRGTPLAEVLRAQAQDAREDSKRELLELSGKKEVAMLVPLVFLILPITIAIAVFPGIFVLQVGFG